MYHLEHRESWMAVKSCSVLFAIIPSKQEELSQDILETISEAYEIRIGLGTTQR